MNNEMKKAVYEGAYEYIKNNYTESNSDSDITLDCEDFETLVRKVYSGMFSGIFKSDTKSTERRLGNIFRYGLDMDQPHSSLKELYVEWIEPGKDMLDIFEIESDDTSSSELEYDSGTVLEIMEASNIVLVDVDEDGLSSEDIVFACMKARIIAICNIMKKELDEGATESIIHDSELFTFIAKVVDGNVELSIKRYRDFKLI